MYSWYWGLFSRWKQCVSVFLTTEACFKPFFLLHAVIFPRSQTQLAVSWLLDGTVASCVLQLTQKEQFPFRGRDGKKEKMTITGASYEGLAAYSQRKTDESICDNEKDSPKKKKKKIMSCRISPGVTAIAPFLSSFSLFLQFFFFFARRQNELCTLPHTVPRTWISMTTQSTQLIAGP